MSELKTAIWTVLALFFLFLAIYSYLSFLPLRDGIREVKRRSERGLIQGEFKINDISYEDPLILICKAVRGTTYVSSLGFILSVVAAVASLYL